MKSPVFLLSAILLASVSQANNALSQAFSSSSSDATTSAPAAFVKISPTSTPTPSPFRPFSRVGIAARVGFVGAGFDVATPLSRTLNLRTGSDFFTYSANFQEEGANVAVNLHMRSGHASLDWFPFNGRFRLSPLMVFANNNRVLASALIPSGSTVTLNGQDYISSYSDPLHGSGSVLFRKVSPGFTFGFGDIVPRTRARFTFPVEAGFYYVGQPGLKVNFSGSACDPTLPPAIGCQSVTQDAGFQHSLAAFIARNNHNLSYASFFPIFSIGLGYAF